MKITIGRKDRADFPELFLTDIHLKVDSGAYTSTIHCHHIREINIANEKFIEFQLLDPSHTKYREEKFKTKNYKKKRVKNSFGISEQRFVVGTTIILFGEQYPIELSLSERSDMKFPILLGRKLLKNRFIVDVSKYDLSFKAKQKTIKKLN
ncbi:MAG: peptidase [Bacteroidetes bacterium CG2_30_33_31]|nr:MAG: peptidase [Bacteroidetes bacterium CG2_30_33_31]